ncbi:MAG: glutamate synthase subunit beta [Clostridiales Family XIII bacterium]|jgi:glutamate synthase (NADPH/NADH) small chain|nr:glutamate synthase subunit beta [Clostridiales Family XIII bacterium]
MGKPTGFLEYEREEAGKRPVAERIKDYDEFVTGRDAEALRIQGARCMDCGVPYCHAGFVVEGLSIGCPLCNLIPEVNDLVYRGDYEEAYKRLSKTHPFPEFTGRVCPALCEGSCTLGEHALPVTIKEIERFVGDEMLRRGPEPQPPLLRTGKRVAVVGSGPAGLACAELLNRLGHGVTVFERADRPGGLLMYGIPNMKLDKSLVLARVALMEEEGVQFVLSSEVGGDYPVSALMRDFDAAVLCAGATRERPLDVPGRELDGVVSAVRFLTAATKNLLDGTRDAGAKAAVAAGKDVIVVGGGDTGTDCVATAIRQGAKSVTQLEIMPKPPAERTAENPWPLWPKVHKTDYGQQEAIALFGADPREYLTTVQEIVGTNGRVSGVKTVRVEWSAQDGRPAPRALAGTEKLRPAQLVLTAMGFTGPERALIDRLGLRTDARGNVATEGDSHRSSLLSVFAAGDMRRGPGLVVWGIAEGRRAARACGEYLSSV